MLTERCRISETDGATLVMDKSELVLVGMSKFLRRMFREEAGAKTFGFEITLVMVRQVAIRS